MKSNGWPQTIAVQLLCEPRIKQNDRHPDVVEQHVRNWPRRSVASFSQYQPTHSQREQYNSGTTTYDSIHRIRELGAKQ